MKIKKKELMLIITILFLMEITSIYSLNIFVQLENFDKYGLVETSSTENNIAYNQECWAESEWSGYNKEYANDNDHQNNLLGWRAESEHGTSWWKVKFENLSKINHIIIYFEENSIMGDWIIEVSNSSYFNGEQIEVLSESNNHNIMIDEIFPSCNAKYLRIYGNVAAGLSNLEPMILEVYVFEYEEINSNENLDQPSVWQKIKNWLVDNGSWLETLSTIVVIFCTLIGTIITTLKLKQNKKKKDMSF